MSIDDNFGLISVIMAAFNSELTIKLAIESVLIQSYDNLELIVVDDCSSDATVTIVQEIAAKDKRVKCFSNPLNKGVSYSRKRATEEAHGEWIAILDSDDLWRQDKLEKQIALQKETNSSLLFTGSAFIKSDGEKIDGYLHAPLEIHYKQLLKQNLISNSSVLVKKNLYCKYYVSGDNLHEDFAIWLGMLRTGMAAYGVDEPLLIYRLSALSKSGNKMKAAKMNWNTYRKVGLGWMQSVYYMGWYTIKGIIKYRKLL